MTKRQRLGLATLITASVMVISAVVLHSIHGATVGLIGMGWGWMWLVSQ